MTKLIIFLIGLLLPVARPCLPGNQSQNPISCLQALPRLEPKLRLANFFLRRSDFTKVIDLTQTIKPFLPHLDFLLGRQKTVSYLILLQNNNEMRANGGFFGSYAVITLDHDQPSLRFQDIYVPDGALVGHVDPPAPIQTAFKQGWFRLRDADWDPDFPTTTATIRWFLAKGGETNPDFLITLPLFTIEKLMAVVGEVEVPQFDFKLNPDNLYTLLQNQAELAAFPGSTQKKDILTATGLALTKKISALKPTQYLQMADILLKELNHQNILANSDNSSLQTLIENQNWSGRLTVPSCTKSGCLNDTVLLIEANLGANKANCCVTRKTVHTITRAETEIRHLISLTFNNTSPLENPLPPRFYGGNYISYLRYFLPANATNIRLTAQPTLPKTLSQYPAPFDNLKQQDFDLTDSHGLREIGFFHLTAAGTSSQLQLSYDLPLDGNPTTYQLNLLKQHGLISSPQDIHLFEKTLTTDLETDFTSNASINLL